MKLKINSDYLLNKLIKKNKLLSKIFSKNLKKCIKASDFLIKEIKNNSNEILNSFSLNYQKKNKLIRDELNNKKKILVIGLGGSSAGAKAISSYLKKDIIFFDNYDPLHLSLFFKENNLNNFRIYVISKSGNTIETIAMLNLTYQHLLKISNPKSISKNIVVIVEDKNNLLCNFAKKKNFFIIEHNEKIGGRFSVFSETSQLLFDLKPDIVSKSAQSVFTKLFNKNFEDHTNPTINSAILMTLKEVNNISINANIIYNYSLKNFSYWFHQLFAESLGKNNNALTPMTSICPKDHHSMMQLYIGGPKDKFFNIYSPQLFESFDNFSNVGFGVLKKKTPNNLLFAQCKGLIKTFESNKIPHRIITCSNKSGDQISNIFELFAFHILETLIFAYANGINAYDQPSVEEIKLNTN